MAVIDRAQLLADAKVFLPDGNVLTDTEMMMIINNVVDYQIPADDDIYYSEALCKTLKSVALLNKSKYAVDEQNIKREKVGGVEKENYGEISRVAWDDYLDSLADICPLLPGGGYSPSRAIGAKINPSEKFVINDCTCTSDLFL
jgi:hypothetical protein